MAQQNVNAKPNVNSGPVAQPQQQTQPTTPPATQRKKRAAQQNPDESKADKFKRLANKRVVKLLKQMEYVRNLGNANNYEYTPEQVSKIWTAIADAANKVKDAFDGKADKKQEFSL